jgi:hypothetical protein
LAACRDLTTGAQSGASGLWDRQRVYVLPVQDRDMIKATAAAARTRRWLLCFFLALVVTGCAHHPEITPDWRSIANRKDIDRMRNWRTTWVAALTKARADGHGAAIAAEGALLDPDAGLDQPAPPAGDYDCRVVRFGKGSGTLNGFSMAPAGKCRINAVDNRTLGFATLDGTQRPIGRIYFGPGAQLTFLGTLSMGDESRPFDYGVDNGRNLIGQVERIGPARWRLVLPYPPFDGAFEVIELLPSQG